MKLALAMLLMFGTHCAAQVVWFGPDSAVTVVKSSSGYPYFLNVSCSVGWKCESLEGKWLVLPKPQPTIEIAEPGNSGFTAFYFTQHRSPSVRRQFQREHPCPSTGRKTGPCRGYVVDHVIPLCKGGPDRVSNMAWQSLAAAKAKDKWECR